MTTTGAVRLASLLALGVVSGLTIAGCGPRATTYDAAREDTTLQSIEETWLSGLALGTYLDCTREAGATLIQAHRGGPRPGFAENAISTFLASSSDGAVFLEMDVTKTGDGHLVLMHDDSVDRTTTGSGLVSEMTLDEFRALRLVGETGSILDEAPPTFAEALAAIDGVAIAQVDLKDITVAEAIAGLDAAQALGRAVLITYTLDDAIVAHTLAPELMISAGLDDLDDLETLTSAGVETDRIVAWLGLGSGAPVFDADLAARGIETSFGDFRAESQGRADYLQMSDNGAEVISVDDVPAASRALRAAQTARGVLATCPQAQ